MADSPPPVVEALAATPVTSPLGTPATARKATHFPGPVVCGPKSSLGGPNYAQGQAILAVRFDISGAKGNFGLTTPTAVVLTFPPGSILLSATCSTTTAFDGTIPLLSFGKTPGAAEYAQLGLGTLGSNNATPTSPAIIGPVADPGGKVYVSLSGTPTVGAAQIAVLYIGPAAAAFS